MKCANHNLLFVRLSLRPTDNHFVPIIKKFTDLFSIARFFLLALVAFDLDDHAPIL